MMRGDAERFGAVPGETSRNRLGWWLNFVLCAAIALFSYRYLLALGAVPPIIFRNALKHPWLVTHVAGAATALLVSPLQFVAEIRRRRPALHRWLGRLYVLGCTVGGVAGIPLAFGSSAGPIATAGFGLLAIAWLTTTLTGWRAGRRKRFGAHREWMSRSFALTYAAVTLRIYLAVLGAMPASFLLPGYVAISFLCWVPNALVAELVLQRARRRPESAPLRPA
jgi:uncharacterized membrane protein